MVNFRRVKQKGSFYFFTVTLRNRKSKLLIEHVDLLRQSFRNTQKEMPFKIKAIVILPDHLHTIWQLPDEDTTYSKRWQKIKSFFTHQLIKGGVKLPKDKRGEYSLWQRRFWEHIIRNEEDLIRHIDYIHYNPVKHGWVSSVKDWPYSSFSHYVQGGLLELNWGNNQAIEEDKNFGE